MDNRTVDIAFAVRKAAAALLALQLDELPEVGTVTFRRDHGADGVEIEAQLDVKADPRSLRAWVAALPSAVLVAETMHTKGGVYLAARGALAGIPFEVWTIVRDMPDAVVVAVGKATTSAAAVELVLDYLDRHADEEGGDAQE